MHPRCSPLVHYKSYFGWIGGGGLASPDEGAPTRLGAHLRHLRDDRQIRQDQLARDLEVTTGWLSEMENGRAWPSDGVLSGDMRVSLTNDGPTYAASGSMTMTHWQTFGSNKDNG